MLVGFRVIFKISTTKTRRLAAKLVTEVSLSAHSVFSTLMLYEFHLVSK